MVYPLSSFSISSLPHWIKINIEHYISISSGRPYDYDYFITLEIYAMSKVNLLLFCNFVYNLIWTQASTIIDSCVTKVCSSHFVYN